MQTCVDVMNKALALLASSPISATAISSGITTSDPDSRGITHANIDNDNLTTGNATSTEIQELNPYTVVQLDLGSEKHLAFIKIYGLKVSAGSSNEFYLQYSTDGVDWHILGRHMDVDTTARFFIRNGPVSARYLRLSRVGSTDMDTAVVTLAEIDVFEFGTNNKDVTCRTLYEVARNRVMTHHAWRKGIVKRRIPKLSSTPASEWSYWYDLPADMVTSGPRAVFTTPTEVRPYKDWEVVGSRLLCDVDETTDSSGGYVGGIWVDYQAPLEEGDLPGHVSTLLVAAVAAMFAEPITDQTDKYQLYESLAWGSQSDEGAGGLSRQARRIESQNKPSEVVQDHVLVDVRYGP